MGLGSAPEPQTEEVAANPENLRAAFDANPELRQAWQDAQAYRETFATPEEARAATALLADLDHMDSLFFSQRPEDHVALARAVASLDPAAFASLTTAMNGLATATQRHGENPTGTKGIEQGRVNNENVNSVASTPSTGDGLGRNGATAAQETFFHATNAAAVQSVLDAIESQVERLLPRARRKVREIAWSAKSTASSTIRCGRTDSLRNRCERRFARARLMPITSVRSFR